MDQVVEVSIPDDDVIDYVKRNYHPADVFDTDELKNWAENNGFVEED